MAKRTHAFFRNQKVKGKVESIAGGGQGVCKLDGLTVFVDRGVPGDFAEIELYDLRKDFAHGRIVNLLEGSPLRQEPPCKLFKVCGGCQWQHIRYEEQLKLKTDIARQSIKRIGGLDPALVLDAIAAEHDLNYRNKVQFPTAQPNNSDRILAGYYKEGSHELVNIKHCPVQPQDLDRLLEKAKEAAEDAGLSAYDEKSHQGLIRHFVFRHSFYFSNSLLTVVLNANESQLPQLRARLECFVDYMEDESLVGICANFNPARGNRILGEHTICLHGEARLVEKLCSRHQSAPAQLKSGLSFDLSPASFFQVNSEQAVTLMDLVLDAALKLLSEKGGDKIPLVIDAYAGVASIAQWISPLASKVIAVEEISEAIADARAILKLNGLDNVELLEGTVESIFPRLLEEGVKADMLILDPPRKGVDRSALEAASGLSPDLIVYVSCNPATLARDLKILSELGYKTISVQPVDLFPQTFHVESLSILRREAHIS